MWPSERAVNCKGESQKKGPKSKLSCQFCSDYPIELTKSTISCEIDCRFISICSLFLQTPKLATHWTPLPILPELEIILDTHSSTHAHLTKEDINYAKFNKTWRSLQREIWSLNNNITKPRVDNIHERVQDLSERVNLLHSAVRDNVPMSDGHCYERLVWRN